jgi:hypothetical protein
MLPIDWSSLMCLLFPEVKSIHTNMQNWDQTNSYEPAKFKMFLRGNTWNILMSAWNLTELWETQMKSSCIFCKKHVKMGNWDRMSTLRIWTPEGSAGQQGSLGQWDVVRERQWLYGSPNWQQGSRRRRRHHKLLLDWTVTVAGLCTGQRLFACHH